MGGMPWGCMKGAILACCCCCCCCCIPAARRSSSGRSRAMRIKVAWSSAPAIAGGAVCCGSCGGSGVGRRLPPSAIAARASSAGEISKRPLRSSPLSILRISRSLYLASDNSRSGSAQGRTRGRTICTAWIESRPNSVCGNTPLAGLGAEVRTSTPRPDARRVQCGEASRRCFQDAISPE